MATVVGTPGGTYNASQTQTSYSHTYSGTVVSGDVAVVSCQGFDADVTGTITIDSLTCTVGGTATAQFATILTSEGDTPEPFIRGYIYVFSAGGANPQFTANTNGDNAGDTQLSAAIFRGIDSTTPVQDVDTISGSQSISSPPDLTMAGPGPICGFANSWLWPASFDFAVGTPTTGWTGFVNTATGAGAKYQNFTSGGTRDGDIDWAGGPRAYVGWHIALADAVAAGVNPALLSRPKALAFAV